MVASVAEKFSQLALMMNEKLQRRWAACEAMTVGRGGIAAVARATGMSPTTIRKGIKEIEQELPQLAETIDSGSIRRPGGGRRPLARSDATLQADLRRLLERCHPRERKP